MKQKTSKRLSSNKQQQNNTSSQNQTSRLSNSPNKTNLHTETNCFDSNTSSCKANILLKSQKLLKRDLLRCSDQRPSQLGSHTLQTSRIRHESQQTQPSTSSSSSFNQGLLRRRRSLSADPYLLHTTNERIGPWPDIPAFRIASAGNDSLNPMKTCRTMKNSRVFSPKYYASLTGNTGKFKYHTSSETYINEYRKKKGYLLSTHKTSKVLPQLLPTQISDDEQLSTIETLNEKASGNDASEHQNDATTERTIISTSDRLTTSTTDLSSRQNPLMKSTNSFGDQPNIPPSIPSLTKAVNEASNMSNFSTVAFRNTQLRAMRHSNHHHHHHHSNQQHQTVILPPLNSSLQYLSSMNSFDRFYSHSNRKPSMQNHQKCFLIEGRSKKSYVNQNKNPPRINSDSEVTSRSQDYSDLQATGGPVLRTTQRTAALAVYRLPRQSATIVTSQNNLR